MRLSHRWYTTSGLLYRPNSRLCARADQRESPLEAVAPGNVGAKYLFEGSDRFAGIKPNSSHGDNSRLSCETQLPMPRRQRFLTMRLNIWVILAALLALLLATRYLQHEGDTQRICADDPSASVCDGKKEID
jgi:hypothetical protein